MIMESSKNALERIVTAVDHLKTLCDGAKIHELTQQEEKQLKEMNEYRDKFELAMDDDLNTADAISAVFELVKIRQYNCR